MPNFLFFKFTIVEGAYKLAIVTAQSIVERGRDNRWCETRSIGSPKYKNLKLREKGKKREVVSLRGLLLSS